MRSSKLQIIGSIVYCLGLVLTLLATLREEVLWIGVGCAGVGLFVFVVGLTRQWISEQCGRSRRSA